MNGLPALLVGTPGKARSVPFILFLGMTFLQGQLGPQSAYWVYAAKTALGAGFVWLMWPAVREMRWAWSWEALLAGVGVFVLWVGLDPFYPRLSAGEPWNPHKAFGEGSGVAWALSAWRILGSTLVVPFLEEVFYRSFLYRYVARKDFLAMPLSEFNWKSFLLVSVVFGFAHHEWLAGILCGMIYQGLVLRKGRLGDSITAHAVTNLLLGLWVVGRGAWWFW